MQTSSIDSLNSTFQKTHAWLHQLEQESGFINEPQAYTGFRAVLHALRDRLTVDETAHLAAQLPMLIRGFFYEGWRPATSPQRLRSKAEFLTSVASRFGSNTELDPEETCRAVFAFLSKKISEGEISDIKHMLPAEVRELWND
jgi:uncharacterized protein (DUF2267 family)